MTLSCTRRVWRSGSGLMHTCLVRTHNTHAYLHAKHQSSTHPPSTHPPSTPPPLPPGPPFGLQDLFKGVTKRLRITRNVADDASGRSMAVQEILEINVRPGWKVRGSFRRVVWQQERWPVVGGVP